MKNEQWKIAHYRVLLFEAAALFAVDGGRLELAADDWFSFSMRGCGCC